MQREWERQARVREIEPVLKGIPEGGYPRINKPRMDANEHEFKTTESRRVFGRNPQQNWSTPDLGNSSNFDIWRGVLGDGKEGFVRNGRR
jgi:hypothetical protein